MLFTRAVTWCDHLWRAAEMPIVVIWLSVLIKMRTVTSGYKDVVFRVPMKPITCKGAR